MSTFLCCFLCEFIFTAICLSVQSFSSVKFLKANSKNEKLSLPTGTKLPYCSCSELAPSCRKPQNLGHDVQWTQYMQWTQCSMDTMSNGSNGNLQWCSMDPMDTMDPLDKNIKLMFTRQTRFGDCVIGSTQMDPLDIQWIHWTCPFDIRNGSIGQLYRWSTCPMDVHWTYPLDMMNPMDPLDQIHNSRVTFLPYIL